MEMPKKGGLIDLLNFLTLNSEHLTAQSLAAHLQIQSVQLGG
jgi:hypothetical protein